jgi:deoxyribonuclease V
MSFDVSPREAVDIQMEMRHEVIATGRVDPGKVKLVAGCDASYKRGDDRIFAAVAVYSYPELEEVELHSGSSPVTFPYVPGLLSFREAPSLLTVFDKLKSVPDVLLVDGQGLAHPRGFGIASHIGVLLGVPTIGVAKSVLVGEYEEPGEKRGSRTDLLFKGERVGVALRTRDGVKPVFVSVGHLVELDSAADFVLTCCRYRLPEPARAAHRLSNIARISG